MKTFCRNKLSSKLVVAALAMCFFAVPGKAQQAYKSKSTHPSSESNPSSPGPAPRSEPEALACTSYPEWSCEPQTVSGQERALAKKRHEKKGSKLHARQMAQERKSSQKASDAPSGLDESFERRP